MPPSVPDLIISDLDWILSDLDWILSDLDWIFSRLGLDWTGSARAGSRFVLYLDWIFPDLAPYFSDLGRTFAVSGAKHISLVLA